MRKRSKTRTENQQLFDRIIDVTLFDGVEGLDFFLPVDLRPWLLWPSYLV